MPLKMGKGPKVRKQNIMELMDAWKSKGSIGTSGPLSKKQAIKRAVAISYAKQRQGKKV